MVTREGDVLSLIHILQANGEALGDYVQDIRKAARVLRLGLPETEVIQIILEGLNPQERSRLIFAERPRCFADLCRLCVVSNTVRAGDEYRGRGATDVQYSSGSLGRAKKDKHGGCRKAEYSEGNGGYRGVASERTVATVTAEKRQKYETNRERRGYISIPTSASREPVDRRYSYDEKEEKRSNFYGSIQDDKNTSVEIELLDSERTLSLIHI